MEKNILSKVFVGLFFFLVLANSNASATDQWLVGQWTGTIFTGGDKLRSLEIIAIEGNTYKGKYGILGEKMNEIPIQIVGDKIEFDTPAKARVVLNKIHETRMDGTFTVTGGKQMGVRYWKNTHKSPPEVVGEWEGRWELGSNPATCRLCVEFADNTQASVYYAWSEWTDEYGKIHNAGWYRKDAKLVEGNKIVFESGRVTFKFEIRDNGKRLIGRNDGDNSITMLRKDPNWLVGNWTGTIFTTDKTRYLNIISADKGVEAQGAYGVTGGKLVPVSIIAEGTKVEFSVPTTESQISLVKATETRMDGTFTNKGGKKFNVRFWKIPHINPPSLDPLMGEWKGQWKIGNNPPQTRFVIEFADTAVASVLYEWSDFVDNLGVSYKAGWWRKDAKILSEKSIEFENIHSTEGKLVFRFDLKEQALMGRINNGWEDINTIVMSRTK